MPLVEKKKQQLIKVMRLIGKPIKVTSEYRSFEEQNELYAQGRTKPGNIVTNAKGGESWHNWRCAFDIVFVKGDTITYDGDWELVGEIGKVLDLEWGGDWTGFPDRPHFHYNAGYTLKDFQEGNIDYEKFKIKT